MKICELVFLSEEPQSSGAKPQAVLQPRGLRDEEALVECDRCPVERSGCPAGEMMLACITQQLTII